MKAETTRMGGGLLKTLWSNLVTRPLTPLAKGERRSGIFKRSLHVRQVDCGSCGACDLEIAALGQPHYDAARLGIQLVASPRHADALLITGSLSPAMRVPMAAALDATPEPRLIVAVGDCACGTGHFAHRHNDPGSPDAAYEIDIRIPGCPPSPDQIIEGLTRPARAFGRPVEP